MSQSSYEKVYERIYETKQFQSVLNGISEGIDDMHIIDVKFIINRPDEIGQPATATPLFVVRSVTGTVSTANGQVYIDIGITDRSMKPLIDEVFGKEGGVPTYFCKKDVVSGRETKKGKESFASWASTKVCSVYKDRIKSAQLRIMEEYRDWIGSEYVATKRQEFMVEQAIGDIKKALSAYDHLGKEVLRTAMDLYLVHSICEK